MDYRAIVESINKIGYPIFETWSAGRTKKEAVAYAKKANTKGVKVSFNFLGEKQVEEARVNQIVNEYLTLINEIGVSEINSDVTVKLSQLGYEIPQNGRSICEENVRKLVKAAEEQNITLWIDMEYAHYVDYTLELYQKLTKDFDNVCVALQANLRRTESDLKKLSENKENVCVRLVKGIYPPPKEEGYTQKTEVNDSFKRLIDAAIKNPKIRLAVATHDENFITFAESLAKKHNRQVEIQMLKGVRQNLQEELIAKGMQFNIYAPYGHNIFAYGVRRAREAKTGIKSTFIKYGFGWIYDKVH